MVRPLIEQPSSLKYSLLSYGPKLVPGKYAWVTDRQVWTGVFDFATKSGHAVGEVGEVLPLPEVTPTSENQEETYILLVDENSQVDSSQVLYLDPNSLANGNVLLMQGSNGTATAVPGQPQAVVTSGTAAPAPVQPQAAPSGSACQQQTVMTTVGDNTPMQPIQTVKEQVTPQQANEQALG